MKSFRKSFVFNSPAEDIYACLTNPRTIELWSGCKAVMPDKPGGEFSWFDGDISGLFTEAVPNRSVRFEWHFGDELPVSPVIITLSEQGGVTKVLVEQERIPDEDFDNITDGWESVVAEGIRMFLNPNF